MMAILGTIIGLDIGGTKTAILEGTYDAVILQRREIPTNAQDAYEVTLKRICDEVDAVLSASREAGRDVDAISVSIGGPLQIEQGVILSPPHLPHWRNAPLKQHLIERFHLPVFIEHDGNAGALAEYYFGSGQGAKNLIFLTAGTGLGGGFILDGRIYRGSTDTAGEVGHIRLADHGPVEYGKAGSWEAFCSGAGMVKLAHQLYPGYWSASLTTRELVYAAHGGDTNAGKVIRNSGEWLGRGLAFLIDTLNPDIIVLGSLGGALGDLFLEPARQVVRAECLALSAGACRIVPAALGARLGDVAALMAAISRMETKGGRTSKMSHTVSGYAAALEDSITVQSRLRDIADVVDQSAQMISSALKLGKKVIVFGNGGSAAQAQHLAGELVGKYGPVRQSLPCIALTADSGVVTCIANDFGYAQVFARQVQAFASQGDIVIGITTSGRSENVLLAFDVAHACGALCIALTGERGLSKDSADIVIAVPSANTARIQEAHGFIVHYWCDVIDALFPA